MRLPTEDEIEDARREEIEDRMLASGELVECEECGTIHRPGEECEES